MFKGLFDRLTGKSDRKDQPASSTSAAATEPIRQGKSANTSAPKLIKVYDSFGREVQITVKDWREKVLGPNLKKHWDNPAELYNMIHSALNDELFEDVDEASQRLLAIDDIPERAYSIRAIVLMKTARWDLAEKVLREGIRKLGETGTLLTNLAKVYAERGEVAKQDATLWQAIQLDPNMENGLLWWLAIAHERGGKPAYIDALQKAAALPRSWLPQMWLAREALEQGNVAEAKALYQQVLAGGLYHSSALMMMSGDLGRNKQVPLIIELVAPVFEPGKHDIQAGFNLLQAYVELQDVAAGIALLNKLYALGISPYKQHLDYYQNAFASLQRESFTEREVDPSAVEIETIGFSGPLWMYGLREPRWLFKNKPEEAEKVMLLPLAIVGRGGDRAVEQQEDDAGRYSRAMALYLAEAVHYWTPFASVTLIPAVKAGGPVVFGNEHDCAELCERFGAEYRYLITGSLRQAAGSWQLRLELWDCKNRTCIEAITQAAPEKEPGVALLAAERVLLSKLGTAAATLPWDAFYQRPGNDAITPYLVATGQLLMLNLIAEHPEAKSRIWGERNMIEWPLNMVLHWGRAEVLKFMYLACLTRAAKYGSEILPEFKERTLRLLADAKTNGSPFAELAPLVWQVFGMHAELAAASEHAQADTHGDWLQRIQAPAP